MPQAPGDRGHRGRVGVAGRAVQQPLARPERPWAPGLAAAAQRPGARRRLPQVLLVGERPVACPWGQRRPFREAGRRGKPVQACPGDLAGEVELVEQHPEAVGPGVGSMVVHVGSLRSQRPHAGMARPRRRPRRAPRWRELVVRAWSVRSSGDDDDHADRRAPVGHGLLLGGATPNRQGNPTMASLRPATGLPPRLPGRWGPDSAPRLRWTSQGR